ncbi:MAG: erythromycin esterase family protein [Phycisphaerae bacterium]|nr:erythromycin esterase family protein [Saprospiraceae bacterium]
MAFNDISQQHFTPDSMTPIYMKFTQFPLLLCIALSIQLPAQQPLNLDFEKKSVEGLARPWGWSPFQFATNTSTTLDSVTKHSGKFSLRFANQSIADDGSSGDHSIGYWLSPHELSGNKISLSGWIKTDKTGGSVHISLGAYGDTGLIKEVKSLEIKGIGDWKEINLAIQEAAPAHSWYIILSTNGSGSVWFDDLHISVNGLEKRSLEVALDFSEKQRRWLKKNSSVVASFKPVKVDIKADYSDLKAFQQAVGDAKIIALGEATHGTSEFFQLKHRLLQFAIQELGVRVFAVEANQLEVEKINHYVCEGVGTAEQVIRVMFAVWNTAEMLELIEWMRAYNIANPAQKVEFVGFDLQDPSLPMDSLSSFVSTWEPTWKPFLDSLQHNYREAWRKQYYPQAADSIRQGWKANADRIWTLVSSKKSNWLSKANSAAEKQRVEWAIQNARVVCQAADIAFSQIVSGRDTFMAENIRWIQSMRKPDTRIIVWAHDSHIARSDHPDDRFNYHQGNSMGKYLSKIFGKDYRAFGLFTYQGQYSATISFTNHKMVAVDAQTGPRGSFDEALHPIAKQFGANQLFLNLRPAFREKNNEWLLQPRPVRFVGYATSDYDFGAMMSVPYQFDGVFFVDKSGASKKLR